MAKQILTKATARVMRRLSEQPPTDAYTYMLRSTHGFFANPLKQCSVQDMTENLRYIRTKFKRRMG